MITPTHMIAILNSHYMVALTLIFFLVDLFGKAFLQIATFAMSVTRLGSLRVREGSVAG